MTRPPACLLFAMCAIAAALSAGGGRGTSPVARAHRRHVYLWWTGDAIARADLDGSHVIARFVGGVQSPSGIAAQGGYVYWTDDSGNNAIGRATVNGSRVNRSFITGTAQPHDVAVDTHHVYWTNVDTGTIGRANLDSTHVDEAFVRGALRPGGIVVDSRYLYWANRGTGSIARATLDGSHSTGDSYRPRGRPTESPSTAPRSTGPTSRTAGLAARSSTGRRSTKHLSATSTARRC